MEEALANLRLLDDEEEAIQEDEGAVNGAYQFYRVGRCLTDSVVHFPSLRNIMADLWHPIGGICITELGEKRYLFQFFNEVDFERFQELPPGLMTESMAKQFGDFCGKFIEYDTSILSLGIQKSLRLRVCLDVTAPLKRHEESYCPFRLQLEPSKIVFGWDLSLHAVVRRRNTAVSRWLWAADGVWAMDLVLDEEDALIALLEGKKRQRIVESPRVILDATARSGSMDVLANSGD
ncbi:hypothetical protein Gotur_011541 [Gossypium turneri]